MSDKQRIVFIERLSLVNTIYLFLTSPLFSEVFYVHATKLELAFFFLVFRLCPSKSSHVKKINYVDFTGSFYDAMEEATHHINDNLFNKYSNNIYLKCALAYCGDNSYSVALHKELLNRYTEKRVKAFVLLKRLSEREREKIFFIPEDNEDLFSFFSPENQMTGEYHIPVPVKVKNSIFNFIKKIVFFFLYPAILAVIGIRFLKRGLIFSPSEIKKYQFGFDVQRNGLVGERGFDEESGTFFLYDDDKFHPAKIIHLVRNGHRLSREAVDLFEKFSCPWTELDTLKVPVNFFFQKIAVSFFFKSIINLVKFSFSSNKSTIFAIPSFALMNMVLTELLNCQYFEIEVFIARDEYSPFHIVRTLIARNHGNRTAGFQWAEWYYHNTAFSHIVFDKYAIAGEFYQRFQKKALENSKTEVIGAAIYGSDTTYRLAKIKYIPEEYEELKKKNIIIGIVSSGYEPESSITREPAVKFLEDVLRFTDKYENVYRVLKPKSTFLNQEMVELQKKHERVLIDYNTKIPRFILTPDLTIVQSISSIFIESLVAGKKVLSYSFSTPRRYNIYAGYSPSLVAFNEEELDQKIRQILYENAYTSDTIIDEIRFSHGYAFDGCVAQRFRKMCLDLSCL